MKRTLAALAMGLASTAAIANTDNIYFHGTISAGGTCPIEVVEPGTPPGHGQLTRITLGNVHASFFDSVGKQTREVPFALRVTPSGTCVINPGEEGYVSFASNYGAEGTDLFKLRPGGALGVALAIQDRTLTNIAPDQESVPYALDEAKPTDMLFYARYQSTDSVIKEGFAESQAVFTVDIR